MMKRRKIVLDLINTDTHGQRERERISENEIDVKWVMIIAFVQNLFFFFFFFIVVPFLFQPTKENIETKSN